MGNTASAGKRGSRQEVSLLYCNAHHTFNVSLQISHWAVEEVVGSPPYVNFHLNVHRCCTEWTVTRRFSNFLRLHLDLTNCLEAFGIRLPMFPPKHQTGTTLSNTILLNVRREALERYLQAVLSETQILNNAKAQLILTEFLYEGDLNVRYVNHDSGVCRGWEDNGKYISDPDNKVISEPDIPHAPLSAGDILTATVEDWSEEDGNDRNTQTSKVKFHLLRWHCCLSVGDSCMLFNFISTFCSIILFNNRSEFDN